MPGNFLQRFRDDKEKEMNGAPLGRKKLPQLIALMFGTLALHNVQAQSAEGTDTLQSVEVRGIRFNVSLAFRSTVPGAKAATSLCAAPTRT
jgi:hypothetical protein